MRRTMFCMIFSLFVGGMMAQPGDNQTTVDVQVRPRAEYRNGALFPRDRGELPARFIANRARLSLGYERSQLEMRFSAQHVGVWGQDPQIDRNGRFILNEAWAKLRFGHGLFAKLGRQPLSYDDERILGALDWNMAGRYHDALKLGYESRRDLLHLILAFNQNDERVIGGTYYHPGAQPYKSMQTLWYAHSDEHFRVSALAMNLGLEGGIADRAETRYQQTFGVNLGVRPDRALDLSGAFYYQMGRTAADVSISAWMAALRANIHATEGLSFQLGSDYLSGDKRESTRFEAFNPLYGTHHKFYGAMDYFYASPFANGLNPGLWDNYAGLNVAVTPSLSLGATGHYFSTTSNLQSATGQRSKGLGTEVDLQLSWKLMKDVNLMAGYSFMSGTETMDYVKGGDHTRWQDWAWLSVNIQTRVFQAMW